MSLKRTIFFLVLFLPCFASNKAWATHERAGYIIWKHVDRPGHPWSYQVTVVTFTKESSYLADRKFLTVCWGDGTCDSIPRVNEYIYPGNDDIKENWYTSPIPHSYAGPAPYQISMTDPNRIASIINIDEGGSVNVPLCLIDTMNILPPSNFGYDNSPVVLNPPIQYADQFETFIYNPSCYDPDGDSLSYQLIIPRQSPQAEPFGDVPLYEWPTQIDPGPKNKESLDPVTGTYTWATPQACGIYNIAILVSEWRKYNGRYYKNGSIDIDMQIIVSCSYDNPPYIYPVKDTCIIAGQPLDVHVVATDPDSAQSVYLSATGTPFEVTNPAKFDTSSDRDKTTGIDTAKGQFTWTTSCDDIRVQPYTVVFNAMDNYITPLNYNLTWNITVVAPPPDSLKDTATGNSIVLSWKSPYSCATATTFLGFTVWRKTGCENVLPDTCDPTSVLTGYTELTPNPIRQYSYIDNSVLQGIDYSYLMLAEFGDSTYSGYVYNEVFGLSSAEVCTHLKKDVPVITNVSVVNTNISKGIMYVAWSKPSSDTSVLDTLEFPGPYSYNFYRYRGFNGSPPVKFLGSYTTPYFTQLNDTSFIDDSLDTKDSAYSYIVKFYYKSDSLMGTTNLASSIYLTLVGNNHRVALTWNENVPWTNDSFQIYRQNHITKAFDYIATTTAQTYTDKGLENDTTYCYYVESYGHYSIEGITNPIVDSSQINCTVPVDTTRPCAPTLAVNNDCNSNNNFGNFINQLQWTLNPTACANSSILKFYIYYSPLENQPLQLIDSTQGT